MSAHPVDVQVGKRLRLRRSMLGISQDQLGKEIGVTFQQIQKYERGANRIGSSRLYEFSRILDVPVNYFFDEAEGEMVEGFGEPASSFDIQQFDNKETLTLIRAYYNIKDPNVRKKVLALIKAMASDETTGDQGLL